MKVNRRATRSRVSMRSIFFLFFIFVLGRIFMGLPPLGRRKAAVGSSSEYAKETRRMFIKVEYGLGNRLRSYANAAALAEVTGRSLVVIWEPDDHLHAKLSDLIQIDAFSFALLEKDVKGALEVETTLFYDYIEDEGTGRVICDDLDMDIYVRSAFLLNSRTIVKMTDIKSKYFEIFNALSPDVNSLMLRVTSELSNLATYTAVHIRAEDRINVDVPHAPGVQVLKASASKVINHRKECSQASFESAIAKQIATDKNSKFLIATDRAEISKALERKFGDRIVSLDPPISCDAHAHSRGKSCIQFALVEMLALSKCRDFISSHWSSYSESVAFFNVRMNWNVRPGCKQNGNLMDFFG